MVCEYVCHGLCYFGVVIIYITETSDILSKKCLQRAGMLRQQDYGLILMDSSTGKSYCLILASILIAMQITDSVEGFR